MLAILAHMLRVFFTGAFRKPRELSWMLGVLLFALALFEAFLGVSLPGDQLGMTGLRQADSLVMAIPLVGTYLSALIFNGGFPGQVLPRIFATHVLLVPGILLAVVPVHALILTWRQKHTEYRGRLKRDGSLPEHANTDESKVTGGPFFPYFALKNGATMMFTFAVIAALATLVTVNPIWLHGPYLPGAPVPSAQPFWYYGVLDGALRLVPGWEIGPVQVGLLIPGLVLTGFFTVLFLYPFIERRVSGDHGPHQFLDRPSDAPARTAFGVSVITFFTVVWAATWVSAAPAPSMITVAPATYTAVLYGLRVALFVLPPLAYALTLAICRSRQRTAAGAASLPSV